MEEDPTEDSTPTTRENSQEIKVPSPKKKNIPKSSRSDPLGAIAKGNIKKQRSDKKRKIP